MMLRLLVKNLLRNKRRTLLTSSSVAVSIFLLASLGLVYRAMGRAPETGESRLRLVTMRHPGMNLLLPVSYLQRIQKVRGVAAVTPMNWMGAYYRDRSNSFANYAVGADRLFDVFSEVKIPSDQVAAFKRDRTGAVVGKRLADKYGWKLGDRITLLGSIYGIQPELTLRGIYTGSDENQLFFHWDYFNEMVGRLNRAEIFWIRAENSDSIEPVENAIDSMFRDSPASTLTQPEPVALMTFITALGNVRGAVLLIGTAVIFAVLLIVANTMALSVRERIPEAAVMRSLGFRPRQIIQLFVGESIALSLAGALIGCAGAYALFRILGITQLQGTIYIDLRMRADTLLLSFSLALLIAVAASGWPAYRASRANIARALRFVG
jgi:putative ABC transport system permease protein